MAVDVEEAIKKHAKSTPGPRSFPGSGAAVSRTVMSDSKVQEPASVSQGAREPISLWS